MARISGTDFAEKWSRRLAGATEDIRRGVEAVTESPGKKAAEKKAKWVAKMASPEVQNKWAANVAATTLETWKSQVIDKGLSRVSSGVEGARDKMAKFGEQLISYQNANLGKIRAMPDVTLSDSKARLDAWFDIMSKFKPTK